MAERLEIALDNGSKLHIVTTQRRDGDFSIDAEPKALGERRSSLCGSPWSVLTQVHGSKVVEVAHIECSGDEADGLVTAELHRPLAVQTADCAPVVLFGPGPWFGVVHAGWRGLEAGVVEASVAQVSNAGGVIDRAWVGPCIGSECYRFSQDDLKRLANTFGSAVVASDSDGQPSFDLRAALAITMARSGVKHVDISDICTACSQDHFSHRARGDTERMATLAWTDR